MGEVVAKRILKRQLDMMKLGIGRHVHRQSRTGKMAGVVKADVMFDHRRLCPLCQLKMVAIVGGVDLIPLNALGDMHQQQRFRRALVTLNANMGDRLRQALCQVQENFRLNGRNQ